MKAPEKIYLPEEPFKYGDSEKCWNYKPLGGIEYVRTDALIKKAEVWINEFLNRSKLIEYKVPPIIRKATLENFEKYMKGE